MAVGCMTVQACVTVIKAVALDLTRLDQEQEDGQERKPVISLRFLKHSRLALSKRFGIAIQDAAMARQ
jgi:hypothetical protein